MNMKFFNRAFLESAMHIALCFVFIAWLGLTAYRMFFYRDESALLDAEEWERERIRERNWIWLKRFFLVVASAAFTMFFIRYAAVHGW